MLKGQSVWFAVEEIDYLRHMINAQGVMTIYSKVVSMLEWPEPKNVMSFWKLLSLTSYYQNFIRNYGFIVVPLTALLRKTSFSWSSEAKEA